MEKDLKRNPEDFYKINKGDEKTVSIAEAKSNFSEYVSRAAFMGEKILLTKRGKPVAAIVSCNDLEKLKALKKAEGLKSVIGKWKDFEDIKEHIENSVKSREASKNRNVSF